MVEKWVITLPKQLGRYTFFHWKIKAYFWTFFGLKDALMTTLTYSALGLVFFNFTFSEATFPFLDPNFFLQTEYRLSKSPSRVWLGKTITLKGEFYQINNKHVKTERNLLANYFCCLEFKADRLVWKSALKSASTLPQLEVRTTALEFLSSYWLLLLSLTFLCKPHSYSL